MDVVDPRRRTVLLAIFLLGAVSALVRADTSGPSSKAYTLAQKVITRAVHKPAYLLSRAFVRIEGRENVPLKGRVILAPNHPSYLDPLLVGLSSPRSDQHFMAKAELFKVPVLRSILRFFNAYPVERDKASPGSKRATIAHTEALLRSEAQVTIFPEGGIRTGTDSVLQGGPLKHGTGHFSANTDAAVVPVLVRNSDRVQSKLLNLFRRTGDQTPWVRPLIVFGKPIYPPAELMPNERAEWMTAQLASSLRALDRVHGGGATGHR